jgi:hypothetical protein
MWSIAWSGVLLGQDAGGETKSTLNVPLQPVYVNQTEIRELGEGAFELKTTGVDSYIELNLPEGSTPQAHEVVAFEYFSPQGVSGLEVRLRRQGAWQPPIDAGSLTKAEGWVAASLPLSEGGNEFWQSGRARQLRIDFGQQAGVMLRVRGLQLRGLTAAEAEAKREYAARREQKRELAETIEGYLQRNDPREKVACRIEQVVIDEQGVVIEGYCESPSERLVLAAVPLHEFSGVLGERIAVRELDRNLLDSQGRFSLVIAREQLQQAGMAGGVLEMWRWQIVEPVVSSAEATTTPLYRPVSNAMYPRWKESPQLPPAQSLSNAKGLGGISPVFGLDELVELGVKHITVNVVVTDLLLEEQGKNSASEQTWEYGGKRWRVNEHRLYHVDQTVRFATDNGIVVALILLLPRGSRDIIVHPEATGSGIYAMPNINDPEGALKYAAVLAFLADRYRGAERGRVDHWIMHNEVDYGWIWTNMGEQPLAVYLDIYVRSMRLAAIQASRVNPHANVFISLTHHWNVPEDPQWRTYAPRAILDALARLGRVEGDFQWGLAYHPYPENLFNPRTWDDKSVLDSFDTPRITMKNIDVLIRYMQQPAFLSAEGKLRPILFSEQGYHTDGYGEEAQRLQGRALLYTWDRLRQVEGVLAYDYHRWVDAAEEGGLLLGLRTVPESGAPAGKKKLGWEVFRAINSDEEQRWRDELLPK